MKPRRDKYPQSNWRSRRLQVYHRAAGGKGTAHCEVCGKPADQGEAAHLHPLGRGRSRCNPDATCSVCGTRLNDPENLIWVCLSIRNDCHAVLDKTMRPACRKKEER